MENVFYYTNDYNVSHLSKIDKFRTQLYIYVGEESLTMPLLLTGDGTTFYEYFSNRVFGVRNSDETLAENGAQFLGGIPVFHPAYDFVTTSVWGQNEDGRYCYSSIQECCAKDFMAEVNQVKKRAAKLGLSEHELQAKIAELFA